MELYKKLLLLSVAIVSALLTGVASHPMAAHAQATSSGGPGSFGTFEVGLPGDTKFQKNASIDSFIQSFKDRPILSLVGMFVRFITGIIVIIGVITMVVGGYFYMTAGGNAHQVEQAKEMIYSSLVGIFIAFISVVILNTINPFLGSKAVEPKLASPSGSNNVIINDPDSTGANSQNGGSSNNQGNNSTSNNGNGGSNTTTLQQINDLQQQQTQLDTQMLSILTKASNENRSLTPVEQQQYDTLKAQRDSITQQIASLRGQ